MRPLAGATLAYKTARMMCHLQNGNSEAKCKILTEDPERHFNVGCVNFPANCYLAVKNNVYLRILSFQKREVLNHFFYLFIYFFIFLIQKFFAAVKVLLKHL